MDFLSNKPDRLRIRHQRDPNTRRGLDLLPLRPVIAPVLESSTAITAATATPAVATIPPVPAVSATATAFTAVVATPRILGTLEAPLRRLAANRCGFALGR